MWDEFERVLIQLTDKYVPKWRPKTTRNERSLPWFNLISVKLYSLNIMSGTDTKITIQKEIGILVSGQEGIRQD